NKSLSRAQKAKNDEFYTQLSDIENELKHYREHFRGKIVYCNCDDPYESNFFKYFAYNFNHLGLKKLIATSYSLSPVSGRQLSLFGQREGEYSFVIEINEINDVGNKGTIDSTDVEYLLKNSKRVSRKLKGDDKYCAGDFRSKECINLLKKSDIVVTNPPFSLFREYVAQLIEYDKKFLIIGSKNAVTYKEIFPLIRNDILWFGHGFMDGNAFFKVPVNSFREFSTGVYDEGSGMVKFRNVSWFTNLDHKKRHEEIILFKKYIPEEYPAYDNYNAIEVSKIADIPADYDGVMGVPITFLDKHNPEQFEIIGCNRGVDQDPNGIFGRGSYLNGKETFKRIFIRNLKPLTEVK
ncbi:TPA: adenine-specific methyltransferase EcoRI family protein, partial [Salmonella enterica subsp. enterica serovar Typhimurium]|nr:adenine-specific methyltransferase EcoRI family protein [Salmonella enterica subsp. enterica serovar Typhimurium]